MFYFMIALSLNLCLNWCCVNAHIFTQVERCVNFMSFLFKKTHEIDREKVTNTPILIRCLSSFFVYFGGNLANKSRRRPNLSS